MDRQPDTVALTYAELAARLGIDLTSAKRRVMRANWHKTRGNDGKVRVSVPTDKLPPITVTDTVTDSPTDTVTPASPAPVVTPSASPPTSSITMTPDALAHILDRLGDVAELRERLGRAEARASAAEDRAKRAEDDKRTAERRAQAVETEAAILRAGAAADTNALRGEFERRAQVAETEAAKLLAETAAEAAALRAELEAWASGNPLARVFRALFFKRPG